MEYDDDEEEEDEIIAELRKIRWKIFEEAGGTPEAYGRYYVELGKKRLAAEAAAKKKQAKTAGRKPAKARAKRQSKVTAS